MRFARGYGLAALALCAGLAAAPDAQAQGSSTDAKWTLDVGVGIERVADPQRLGIGDEALGERVGDLLLDEDPLDRDAALAGV